MGIAAGCVEPDDIAGIGHADHIVDLDLPSSLERQHEGVFVKPGGDGRYARHCRTLTAANDLIGDGGI